MDSLNGRSYLNACVDLLRDPRHDSRICDIFLHIRERKLDQVTQGE